jgi:hypothetical protein
MRSLLRASIGGVAASMLMMMAPAFAAPQTSDTFTVTTAGDNGSNASPTVGSLRWAIKQANANASVTTINFALSGCPTIMNLASVALPDITTDVTIDGYSQTGSVANVNFGRFQATLCVVLNGAGGIATGLHTSGGGRLTVKGLGFAGFSDAAIRLDAGTGNAVFGNQIGGIGFTVGNSDGVRISGTAADTLVGGESSGADVNMIVGNTGTGVYIDAAAGGNMVTQNLIGVGPTGESTNGNQVGVYIFNSPGNDVDKCVISSNSQQGVLIAGSSAIGNRVHLSKIGTTTNGAYAPNGAQGVQITFGANGNTIGALAASDDEGNNIYASGDAVWVTTSGGAGNSIRANQQMYSTGGLSMDLGAAGATGNDAGDTDTGANNLQNFPVMLHAFRSVSANWAEGVLDGSPNDTFRVDIFWTSCCSAGTTRGNATYYLGHGSILTDASGHAHFWVRLLPITYPSVGAMSAIVTSASGDSSEIGVYAQEIVGDMIFRDDFEP